MYNINIYNECIILRYQLRSNMQRLLKIGSITTLNTNGIILVKNIIGYNYSYVQRKKFINIRKIKPISPTEDQKNIDQQSKFQLKSNLQWEIPIEKPNRQFHQLNFKIKNAQKIAELLYLFGKNNYKMTMQQHLAILDRIVTLHNLQAENHYEANNNTQELGSLEEKIISKIFKKFDYIFFKGGYSKTGTNSHNVLSQQNQINESNASIAPEYYIGFINIVSKFKNKFLLYYSYNNFITKIMDEQLILKPQKNEHNKPDIVQISDVLTLEDNIRLLTALFRLFNNKQLDLFRNEELLQNKQKNIKLIKSIIRYLHIPVTPPRISTQVLTDLVNLYIKGYPQIRLSRGIVKSIIREVLKRIKITPSYKTSVSDKKNKKQENSKNKNKNSEEEVEQNSINQSKQKQTDAHWRVFALKKLFSLEKLLFTHLKTESLFSEILATRDNNIVYNEFYMVQTKINKLIVRHLAETLKNPEIQKNYNEHIDLLPMICNHLHYLYFQVPIQVLAKCEMIGSINKQFEAILRYVQFGVKTLNFLKTQQNTGIDISRLTLQFNKLLGMLVLRDDLRSRLPSPIIDKIMQQRILGPMYTDFSLHSPELQILLIVYLYKNKSKNSDIEELSRIWRTNNTTDHFKQRKLRQLPHIIYLLGLMGNQQHIKSIKSSQQTIQDEYKIFGNVIKTAITHIHSQQYWHEYIKLFKNDSNYNFVKGENKHFQVLSEIISKYIQTSKSPEQTQQTNQNNNNNKRVQKLFGIIIQRYGKISRINQLFSVQTIQLLSKYYDNITKISDVDQDSYDDTNIMGYLQKQQSIITGRMKKKQTLVQDDLNSTKNMVDLNLITSIVRDRIDQMLARLQFVVLLFENYLHQSEQCKQKYMWKIYEIYEQESQLLKYPGIYQSKHIQKLHYFNVYFADIQKLKQNTNKVQDDNNELQKKAVQVVNKEKYKNQAQNKAQDEQEQEDEQYKQIKFRIVKGKVHKQEQLLFAKYKQVQTQKLSKWLNGHQNNMMKISNLSHLKQIIVKINQEHSMKMQNQINIKLRIPNEVSMYGQIQDLELVAIGKYHSQNKEYNVGYIIRKNLIFSEPLPLIKLTQSKYYSSKYGINQLIYIPIY